MARPEHVTLLLTPTQRRLLLPLHFDSEVYAAPQARQGYLLVALLTVLALSLQFVFLGVLSSGLPAGAWSTDRTTRLWTAPRPAPLPSAKAAALRAVPGPAQQRVGRGAVVPRQRRGQDVVALDGDTPVLSRRDAMARLSMGAVTVGMLSRKAEDTVGSVVAQQSKQVGPTIRDDILPQQSEFLAMLAGLSGDTHHSADFVVYLTGFLINFDDQWRGWWAGQRQKVPFTFSPIYSKDPVQRAKYIQDTFRDMAMALKVRVDQVQLPDLCRVLMDKYSALPEARHQLAILFSHLPAADQPKEWIQQFLMEEMEARGVPVDSPATLQELRSATGAVAGRPLVKLHPKFVPPELVARNTLPVYEADQSSDGSGRWVVPAALPSIKEDSAQDFQAEALAHEEASTQNLTYSFNGMTVLLLAAAGMIASSVTNSLVHPIDNVKISQQTYGTSATETLKTMVKERGLMAPLNGILATFNSNLLYGMVVFPGFELGKLWLSGQVSVQEADDFRLLFCILAGVVSTVLGCFASVPWEAAKIRIIAQPGYASNAFGVAARMIKEEGVGSLYAGYPAYVYRNTIYTIVKFCVFDYFLDVVHTVLPSVPTDGSSFMLLSLAKGVSAGMLAVVASQPLDVMLTRVSQTKEGLLEAGSEIWAEKGVAGFLGGLGLRCVNDCTLIAIQFVFYDFIKFQLFEAVLAGVQ